MKPTLEQAQAAVQSAQAVVDELVRAQALLRSQLPLAQQALTSAHAQLRKATQDDGAALAAQRRQEIERLEAAITAAKGGSQHV
ncbi:hypothetical protein [Pseudomonas putida]|uniref:hypothetical protein n=1 Tax=Pseudomonas putida TaxID=303 RepID=UPI0039DF8B9B